MINLTDEQLAEAHKQARIHGLPMEGAGEIWAAGYIQGRADEAAEICRREGHTRLVVTTATEFAHGVERYLCGRCPKSWTVTTVEA